MKSETIMLGACTTKKLVHYLTKFFESQDMKTTTSADKMGTVTIQATSTCDSFTSDLVGLKNTCEVVITDNHDGTAKLVAGKGSWVGKATGAAFAAVTFAAHPILGSILIASTGKNAIDQIELPANVISAAKAYLAHAAQNDQTKSHPIATTA